eukprot:1524132-Alexandrium_andersonii.AAC.1
MELIKIAGAPHQHVVIAQRLQWLAALPRRGGMLLCTVLRRLVKVLLAFRCLGLWTGVAVYLLCKSMVLASPA